MNTTKYTFLILCLFCLNMVSVFSQESLVSSGGNASGSGGSVSYSIGQLAHNQYNSTGGWTEQGVQHAYEIYTLNISSEVSGASISCKIYPNPSTDILILDIKNVESKNMYYQLFDSAGKLLDKSSIDSQETTIVMRNYCPGTYFLKINSADTSVKTLKIIKN